METKKNILLTGACGTIGYEILKQLYQKTDTFNITVFDIKNNKSERKLKKFKDKINIVYGDICETKKLQKICTKKDIVIHLAAIIPPLADENPELAYKVNTIGTKQLINNLEQHSPNAFFLYSSSISVYGDRLKTPLITVNDPLIPSKGDEYAKTKIHSEKIIQNSKLDWSIFRLGAIMGGHKMSKLMFHQPLKTSLEIATPKDTARAFVNAIDKQNQLSKNIYNLGGGKNCQTNYEDFLSRSFKIYGLGKLNFNKKAFAEKNFHCGFYADGNILNDILNFRQDSLDTYFENEKRKVSLFKKFITSIFKSPIKKILQRQSEPLIALKNNNRQLINHFFYNTPQ